MAKGNVKNPKTTAQTLQRVLVKDVALQSFVRECEQRLRFNEQVQEGEPALPS